jgi:heme-degrading monooxygenase HmoA
MFVRLTFLDFLPDKIENARRIFNEEIIGVVKAQKGNIGIWLLEPTDKNEGYISLTEWATEADAELYQFSGVYKKLVDKLKDMYKSKPVLKTYTVESKVAVEL